MDESKEFLYINLCMIVSVRQIPRGSLTALNIYDLFFKALNLQCKIALQKMYSPTRMLVSHILVTAWSPWQTLLKT